MRQAQTQSTIEKAIYRLNTNAEYQNSLRETFEKNRKALARRISLERMRLEADRERVFSTR